MHERIGEAIDVVAIFADGKVKPFLFRWRKRKYKIDSVNLEYSTRDGAHRVYYFAVSAGPNFYKLRFHSGDMAWRLEEIYCD